MKTSEYPFRLDCGHDFYSHQQVKLGSEVWCRRCNVPTFVSHRNIWTARCNDCKARFHGLTDAVARSQAVVHIHRCPTHVLKLNSPLGNTTELIADNTVYIDYTGV